MHSGDFGMGGMIEGTGRHFCHAYKDISSRGVGETERYGGHPAGKDSG